jgi:hypothetical protein
MGLPHLGQNFFQLLPSLLLGESAFPHHEYVLVIAGEALRYPNVAATHIGQIEVTELMGRGPVLFELIQAFAGINVERDTFRVASSYRMSPGNWAFSSTRLVEQYPRSCGWESTTDEARGFG